MFVTSASNCANLSRKADRRKCPAQSCRQAFAPFSLGGIRAVRFHKDGQPYRNTYTWYFQMKDGEVIKAIAFFDTRDFDEFWTRVSPVINSGNWASLSIMAGCMSTLPC